MTDFNELMKQAQQMQEQFKEAQLNLVSLIVEGQSGAGLVSIKINGRHDVVGVSLDDSIMSEDKLCRGLDRCCI